MPSPKPLPRYRLTWRMRLLIKLLGPPCPLCGHWYSHAHYGSDDDLKTIRYH